MKESDLKRLIREELIKTLKEQQEPGDDVEKLGRALRASLKKQSELAAVVKKNSRAIETLTNAVQMLNKAVGQGATKEV